MINILTLKKLNKFCAKINYIDIKKEIAGFIE
jgi:hypothetical protein